MSEFLRRTPDADLRKEVEIRPAERIVITGMAQITPLGGTEETWERMLEGESGVKPFDVGNFRTNIAGPVEFDPEDFFDRKTLRSLSRITAMSTAIVGEAAGNAGLLDPDNNRISGEFDRKRIGSWISSGVGASHLLIGVKDTIRNRGSERISPTEAIRLFPEQVNAQPSIMFGYSGWGGNTSEACATSLSNIVEGVRTIRQGYNDIVFAGGFEEALAENGDIGIGIFAAMRHPLSTRNDEPERASRPFDKDRDGFVLSSGGGIVVLESLEHALSRFAPIYAEVLGYSKSMDGVDPTSLDSHNVALTIAKALYVERHQAFRKPDAIFAHATSTVAGDPLEAEALRQVFGDELSDIPVTAIKSTLGHLAGGAGVVNVIAAIKALNNGVIPHIINLENVDPEVADLNLVREKPLVKDIKTVLATAYGFGGYNAAVLLGKYQN